MLAQMPPVPNATFDEVPPEQEIVSGAWIHRRWIWGASLAAAAITVLLYMGFFGTYSATAQVSFAGSPTLLSEQTLQERTLATPTFGPAVDSTNKSRSASHWLSLLTLSDNDRWTVNIRDRVSVKPTDLKDVFSISYRGPDRWLAAPFVNELARRLIEPSAMSLGQKGHIVTYASTPVAPAGSILFPISAALVVGVTAAAAILLLRERMQPGLKGRGAELAGLNLPLAFMTPAISGERTDRADVGALPIVSPGSYYARAFRLWLRDHIGVRSIAICSPLAGEGKSTTAISLARSAALSGKQVVIIDCDGRMRAASKALGVRHHPGLVQVIDNEVELGGALVRDEASSLMILGYGNQPAMVDLWSARRHDGLSRVVSALEADFDLVIIDTPPLLALAEARQTAGLAANVLLVARWRKTPLGAIRAAMRMLTAQGLEPSLVLTFVRFIGLRAGRRVDPQNRLM